VSAGPDLARSITFYETLLGFRVLDSSAESATLGVDQALIELKSGATTAMAGRRLGLYHFAILLPDRPSLGSCLSHLLDLGITPGASDHLVSEALYIHDPDNLGIEIYRDRPRSEWRTRGVEIAMASDPLDFEEVMAAGGGAGLGGNAHGHDHGPRPFACRLYRRSPEFLSRGRGTRRRRIQLPWCPIRVGRGLPPSSWSEHLGRSQRSIGTGK
jgi:catechol 2,3-dioxygenase